MPAPILNRVVKDFECAATGDQTVHLKRLRGQNVVIYFYPKDSTPGCTTEGQDFRDLHSLFRRKNTVIFGVSRDSLASHDKFKAKHEFPFELLSDTDEKLCEIFDVIHEKSLYGRKFMGIVRSTFLIDDKGKLSHAWRKVKVKGHAQEVLDAIRNG